MRWFRLVVSVLLATACAHAVAGAPAPSNSSAPQPQPALGAPATPSATAGRERAELLRDYDFRVAFDDVQRLRIATDFEEIQFGLLRVTLGPGFATVSSARYNLERLFRTYRVASYRSEETLIELWKDGSKIGEVTTAGVRIDADAAEPR
jgi:hypothetical protein